MSADLKVKIVAKFVDRFEFKPNSLLNNSYKNACVNYTKELNDASKTKVILFQFVPEDSLDGIALTDAIVLTEVLVGSTGLVGLSIQRSTPVNQDGQGLHAI